MISIVSRLGINLVEGKAARKRTGHLPHMGLRDYLYLPLSELRVNCVDVRFVIHTYNLYMESLIKGLTNCNQYNKT